MPPAVPPEASQPGVPGGFSAGSRFSETPPEPLGFSDTAGGPMTSRAERLLGRRWGWGGAIFLGNFSVSNKSKAEELRSWCCFVYLFQASGFQIKHSALYTICFTDL